MNAKVKEIIFRKIPLGFGVVIFTLGLIGGPVCLAVAHKWFWAVCTFTAAACGAPFAIGAVIDIFDLEKKPE